jgi:deoxyribodipyrimidine photolyase
MQQLQFTEPYYPQSRDQTTFDYIAKQWFSAAPHEAQTLGYFLSEPDIVANIKNMTAEIVSLKQSLSTNSDLLKATNDLLNQIATALNVFEAQSYFWTDEWQKAESEADNDIHEGRTRTFDNMVQLVDFLHSKSK